MTGFHSATYRTEPLPIACLEWRAAVSAIHRRFVSYTGMIPGYRAGAAICRSARGLCATVCAMLRILARSAKLAPVLFFVARYTESYPVVYVKHQFGMLGNWLNMMSVQITTSVTALAGVAVSLINESSPLCQIALCRSPLSSQGCSSLPCRRVFACLVFSRAGSRAINSRLVFRRECHATLGALSGRCWIAPCPAGFRAILGGILAVCLDTKFRTADGANLDDLGVFHGRIIPHNTQNEKRYIAVCLERWATQTGQTPVLMDGAP